MILNVTYDIWMNFGWGGGWNYGDNKSIEVIRGVCILLIIIFFKKYVCVCIWKSKKSLEEYILKFRVCLFLVDRIMVDVFFSLFILICFIMKMYLCNKIMFNE